MKKLLLILLLAPTLIQAEEFNLVCEGEKLTFDGYGNENKYPETIGVNVREESIKIGKYSYSNDVIDSSSGFIESSYIKDNDLITVNQTYSEAPTKKNCGLTNYSVNIDRITGMIKTEWRQTDICMDKKYFMHVIYEGKCKKQKGNAF